MVHIDLYPSQLCSHHYYLFLAYLSLLYISTSENNVACQISTHIVQISTVIHGVCELTSIDYILATLILNMSFSFILSLSITLNNTH